MIVCERKLKMATRKPLVNVGGYVEELPAGDFIELESTIEAKKALLIYYGYPIAYKSMWEPTQVISEISATYKYWVVGHTYQDPSHEEYDSTVQIMQGVRANGVKLYGYIPLGTSSYNYSLAQITTIVDQWKAIGVDGIFLDEYGYDYGVTRQRQIDVVNMVHSKGLPVCANAWVFEEFVSDTLAETGWPAGDWKYERWLVNNPNNLPSPKQPGDSYLIENFCYDNLGPTNVWYTQERCANVRSLATAKNVDLWAVAVFGEMFPGILDTDKLGNLSTLEKVGEYISANAFLFDIEIVGSGGYSFGSNGTPVWAPLYSLPDQAIKPSQAASNDYTAKTSTRYFGQIRLQVTNTDTQQLVEITSTAPKVLGQIDISSKQDKIAPATANRLVAYNFVVEGSTTPVFKEATFFDVPSITAPALPGVNTLRHFTAKVATKTLPHILDSTNINTALQPAFFGNSIFLWLPGTGATLAINFGVSFLARNNGAGAIQAHPIKTSTSAISSMARATFFTGATATGSSGIQSQASVAWRGNGANLGGFFFYARFGVEVFKSDMRIYLGLSPTKQGTVYMNSNASTWPNSLGICKDSADQNWFFLATNDSGVATKFNTNIKVLAGVILDFYMYAPPNADFVSFSLINALTKEILAETTITTNLPLNTVFLFLHAHNQSVTGTNTSYIALNKMYCETNL